MSGSTDTLASTITIAAGSSLTFLQDSPYSTRIQIAKYVPEEIYIPPHWHELHDEIFHVIEGRLEVLIGTDKKFYVPEDGQIIIPKGTLHSLRIVKGEECIFEEGAVGMGEEKELFFRNWYAGGKEASGFFEIMQIMYHGDMRPVLPLHIKWLERLLVGVAGYCIAPLLGYKLAIPSIKKNT